MKNVEDIYPLSAMQEMMLLHSLSARERKNDVLFNQFCYRLEGELNVSAFQQAWQYLLDRHAVLRTAFVFENLKAPLQIVRKRLVFPFKYFNWKSYSVDQQQKKLDAYCSDDRQQGFDTHKAPLTRIALMQCAPNRYFLVWSSHHLLLDRWCLTTVFDELFVFYQAECQGRDVGLVPSGSYRQYIQWIQAQNRSDTESFWREILQDFIQPTGITQAISDTSLGQLEKAELTLSQPFVTDLQVTARDQGVTMNTVIQAAWALLLNRHTGKTDVLFGAAVSGRPAELEGVESIIGTFINNLPVRIQLIPEQTLSDWFRNLQGAQQKRARHDYPSLLDIHSWSQLPANEALFDTLLVWLASDPVKIPENLTMTSLAAELNTAYPLTVGVAVSVESIVFLAVLDSGYETGVSLNDLLQEFAEILQSLASALHSSRLSDLRGFRYAVGLSDAHRSEVNQLRRQSVRPIESQAGIPPPSSGREDADSEMLKDLLLAAWHQLLAVSAIQLDDNFFDLGGTSLLAARLHAVVEASTCKKIPLLALFRQPTIWQMAETLRLENWPLLAQTVFPIRETGVLPPLFCIASPEVNTVGYSLLSRHLDSQQPVYVLQQPPDSDELRRLTPDELPIVAALYLTEMRRIQGSGPYRLLGMCSGAQIGVEMARLLAVGNENVAFLGIINTWGYYTVSRVYYLTRVVNRIAYYHARIRSLFTEGSSEALATLNSVIRQRMSAILSAIKVNQKKHIQSANNAQIQSEFDQQDVVAETDNRDPWIEDVGWTWKDPKADKYFGTATVFKIKKQQYWRSSSPVLGWDKQVESVFVEELPGKHHDSILREPHIRILAEKLRKHLKQKQIGESV